MNKKKDFFLMTEQKIKRTILLKAIDPIDLYQKYQNGYTNNLTIPDDKTKLLEAIKLDYQIGQTQDDPRYELTDSSNHKCRVFTTNSSEYMKFYQDQKYVRESSNESEYVTCQLVGCGEQIKKSESIGIPLHLEIISNEQKCQHVIISVEGHYCSFEHMYQVIKLKTGTKKRFLDGNYVNVDHNARLMYHLMYPKEPFKTISVDPGLITENNGSLNKEDVKKHRYIPIPGVITLPAKRQFLQTDPLP